jgi:adenosine deaminase
MDATSLRSIIADMPKIDLHRHLEGSLRLHTLVEIGRQNGLDLPSFDPEELRPYVQVIDDPPDFHGFLAKFRLLRQFYTDRESVARLAYEVVADAAADNIKYLELRFNPVALSRFQGFGYEQVTEWVVDAVDLAQKDFDTAVRLIVQIGRDESQSVANALAQTAIDFLDRGVVGLDLAGDETGFPAEPFAPIFQRARAEGLHITIHAGEAGPAANVREAVEKLGAERIGHGVRSIEDDTTVEMLQKQGITLEMCPTSNQHTGTVADLAEHPFIRLQDMGVRVTVNTDDPSISNITLTDEYLTVIGKMAVPATSLTQAIIHATEGAFLPQQERDQLTAWFRSQLDDTPLTID